MAALTCRRCGRAFLTMGDMTAHRSAVPLQCLDTPDKLRERGFRELLPGRWAFVGLPRQNALA